MCCRTSRHASAAHGEVRTYRSLAQAETTMEPTAVSPACGDRGGEREGQHPHERETDDFLHGQLLLDGLHGCEVGPPWRRERGSADLIVRL